MNYVFVPISTQKENSMKTLHPFLAAVFSVVLVAGVSAQEVPIFPQPTKEHQWLQQFVGEWDTTAEGKMGPDQPAITCKGTAKSRMLGGFWLLTESDNEMMGVKINALQTIGYDSTKKKYIGTWVDSMLNHLWEYEGSVDATGKKLTLEAEGPNMLSPGKTAKFRDEYEFKSPDHIEATSSMQGEDGKWVQFMVGQLRRKK
jgi:hypothetical protein